MVPDKSVLLEQITNAIKRNLVKKRLPSKLASPGKAVATTDKETFHRMLVDQDLSLTLIKKLEDRIVGLEDLNDHLLYFIHFLFENFSDLVKDIMPDIILNHDVAGTGELKPVIDYDIPANATEKIQPSPTRRELEILGLLVKGLCAKEIANELCISETTVITHKKNLKEKFNAKNCAELISKAFTTPLDPKNAVYKALGRNRAAI